MHFLCFVLCDLLLVIPYGSCRFFLLNGDFARFVSSQLAIQNNKVVIGLYLLGLRKEFKLILNQDGGRAVLELHLL